MEKELPVGLTLQVYIYRIENDITKAIKNGSNIRLVKGAFSESSQIAHTSKKAIDTPFYKLSKAMLSAEAKANGFYPIFATHDKKMLEAITGLRQKIIGRRINSNLKCYMV